MQTIPLIVTDSLPLGSGRQSRKQSRLSVAIIALGLLVGCVVRAAPATVESNGPSSHPTSSDVRPSSRPAEVKVDVDKQIPKLVFGEIADARSVVFLCDGTGSMLSKMAVLRDELTEAVSVLKPTQSFNVVFYRDEKPPVKFADSLTMATPQAKCNAGCFLGDWYPSGGIADPIPALEFSLKLNPEMLYFLTSAADFPDPKAFVRTINALNKDRVIKINTILLVEDKVEREQGAGYEALMGKIAKENGGKFRWIEID